MDEKEKINDSYLTIEAKTDINRMLGNEESGGGSSFNTQLETTGGLTLGKGTEDEESLTTLELKEIKNNKVGFVFASGGGSLLQTEAHSQGDVFESGTSIKITGLESSHDYLISEIRVNMMSGDIRPILTTKIGNYYFTSDSDGEATLQISNVYMALQNTSPTTLTAGIDIILIDAEYSNAGVTILA